MSSGGGGVTAIRWAVYHTWFSLQPQMLEKNKLPETAGCPKKTGPLCAQTNSAQLRAQKTSLMYINKHIHTPEVVRLVCTMKSQIPISTR